jgi:hypothetical protein
LPPRKKTTQDQENFYKQLDFASNSSINKPFISGRSTSLGTKLTKAQIKRLMQNPIANYKELQQISQLLSSINGIYARIIEYFSSVLTYDHFLYPSISSSKMNNTDKMINSYEDFALYLDKMNLKYNLPIFVKSLYTKGEVFVYKLEDSKSIIYQEIPNELCRLSISREGVFGYEVNMNKFNDINIVNYPLEFQDKYTIYQKLSGAKGKKTIVDWQNPTEPQWCQISDKGIAFPTLTNASHSYPPLSYLFCDILDVDNVKDLKKEKDRLDNTKMIHNQVPIDKETGLPTMDLELAKKYNESIKKNISEGVFSVTNPFDTQVLNLQSGQQRTTNMVEEAIDLLFADAGVSDMLFSNKKASGEALKMSVKADMATLFSFILPLFSNYINYELKKINSVYKWKIKILEVTYFDRADQLKQFISLLPLGASRYQYMALQGLSPLEALNTLKFEQISAIDNLLVPKMNSHVMSSSTSGRPTVEDGGGTNGNTDVGTNTETWRETQ